MIARGNAAANSLSTTADLCLHSELTDRSFFDRAVRELYSIRGGREGYSPPFGGCVLNGPH